MSDKKFLEGKELEGKIGEVGSYFLDVDKNGLIQVGASVGIAPMEGDIKVKNELAVEVHLLTILEKVAAKNGKGWDDQAIAGIKAILGMIG